MAILKFEDVSKEYRSESGPLTIYQGLNLEVEDQERVAILGRSGSGKSTFLHLAAGLEAPTQGSIELADKRLEELSDRDRTLLRRRNLGFVFQFFHLLPHLSVRENIALPTFLDGKSLPEVQPRIDELLERVELLDRAEAPARTLSGGEQQRVALCRALIHRPRLILADEPTGNLDQESGAKVLDLLFEVAAEAEGALVVVTHQREVAARAQRVLEVRDHRLFEAERPNPEPA